MDKNYDNNLNGWLSAILGLNAIFGGISVVSKLFSEEHPVDLQNDIFDIIIGIIFVYGCVKLFFASRIGFYAIIIAGLLNVIMGGFCYIQSQEEENALVQQMLQSNAFRIIWISIGKIVFIMLLMLLRDKGKNAYQVLWNKE